MKGPSSSKGNKKGGNLIGKKREYISESKVKPKCQERVKRIITDLKYKNVEQRATCGGCDSDVRKRRNKNATSANCGTVIMNGNGEVEGGKTVAASSQRIRNHGVVSTNCDSNRLGSINNKTLNGQTCHIRNNKRPVGHEQQQCFVSPSKKMKVFLKGGCNTIYHPSNHISTAGCYRGKSKAKVQERLENLSHPSSINMRNHRDGNSVVDETKQSHQCSGVKQKPKIKKNRQNPQVKYFGFKKVKKGVTYDIVCTGSNRHRQDVNKPAADEFSCKAAFHAYLIALKNANNGELGLSSNVLTPRLALIDRNGHRGPLPADFCPSKRKELIIDSLEREDICDALRVAISQKTGLVDLPDSKLVERIKVVRKEWCKNLDIGDMVETRYKDGKWYKAKIITGNGRNGRLKLHFVGWSNKCDDWVKLHAPWRNVVPVHTFTRPRRYKKTWCPKPHVTEEWVLEDSNGRILARAEANNLLDASPNTVKGALPDKQMGLSLRSGGVCPLPHADKTTTITPTSTTSLLIAESEDEDSRATTEDTQALSTLPDDGDTVMSLTEEDANDWHCSICMKISVSGGSLVDKTELVCCDGPCLRSFHMGCLEPDNDVHELFLNQVWLCDTCTARSGPCFLCNVKDEQVKPCEARQCGRFYHPNCLRKWNGSGSRNSQVPHSTSTVQKKNGDTNIGGLICGRHSCKGCGEKGERQDLLRCLLCPVAYHPKCAPASMPKLLEARLLMCPAHPDNSLPELPAELNENEKSDGKRRPFSWHEDLPLPAAVPPLNAPSHDLRHFRLPMSFLEEYRSHTITYKPISSLLFRGSTRPNRITPDGSCVCVPKKGGGGCDEFCLNRLLHVECYGLGGGKKGKKKTSSTSTRYTHANCPIGPKCRNRRMQQPKSSLPRTEVFAEFERGLGVRTIDFIPKDAFIFEYVGEVIEPAEMERRLEAQHHLRPNDSDHYIMELQAGLYVDAKHYGNTSRFINHSCNPNCVVERWNIGPSDQRIGIFTKKDIQPGEALSYDYSFCTSDASAFICKCGAENCRGTLAAKKRVKDKIDPQTLSAPERKEYFKREKKKKEGQIRRDKQRLWMTGRFLPGGGMEEVKDGPTCNLFGICRLKRVFLPFNAIRGMDMISRKQRLENRT